MPAGTTHHGFLPSPHASISRASLYRQRCPGISTKGVVSMAVMQTPNPKSFSSQTPDLRRSFLGDDHDKLEHPMSDPSLWVERQNYMRPTSCPRGQLTA